MAAAKRAAGKAAKEGLEATDSALKGFLSRAKDAIKSGVDKGVVAPIVDSVKAGTRTVKAADEKLIDTLTRTKKGGKPTGRKTNGQERTVQMPGGTKTKITGGVSKKNGTTPKSSTGTKVKRGAARAVVYGGPAVGVAVAGDAVKKEKPKTKRELAAEARIAAQEKSDDQIDGLTAALKKKEADKKKKARLARNRKMQAAVNATNPGAPKKEKGKGKGKLFPKFRPFGGVIARALLGDDEKFGGERGMIDFIRTKKKNKGGKKPVKKNMGGMVNKASANKASSRGKPRGVGAATRGYGRAMR